jgi:hypothetical protein
MHASSLLAGRQQPQVDIYDVNVIGNTFANWNFGFNNVLDQNTQAIAIMTVNEIQNHAVKGHPIRVGFFDVISENGFDNPAFQDLLLVVMKRTELGVMNQEFGNLNLAVQKTIPVVVKACACSMAAEDPDFMATLSAEEQRAVRENSDIWGYLVQLIQGAVQFIPFAQMNVSNGLSTVSGSTQSALEVARSMRGAGNTGFVENYSSVGSGTHNNNANAGVGRYGRKAQTMMGVLEGSMQEALSESGLTNAASVPYQSRSRLRAQSPEPTAQPKRSFSQAATQRNATQFDNDVTDFSQPMKGAESNVAPEPVKPIFSVPIGDKTVDIVRERKEGFAAWKASALQPFHPAWCTRLQTVRYFETSEGHVIVILQDLKEEEKEIAMNYDAHAIDPTKGKPDPKVRPRPVREEAKVLYGSKNDVSINVTIAKTCEAVDNVQSAIRVTRLGAQMSSPVPDAYPRLSAINDVVIYDTAEEAKADEIVINSIATAKDFAEAAKYVPMIKNEDVRTALDARLVAAVNRAIVCELGVGVRISNFAEDGGEIVQALAKAKGSLIGQSLAAHQTNILTANVRVLPGEKMVDYANNTMAPEGEEKVSDEVLARTLFMQHSVCVVWVNFTNDELAIGMPPKGPAPIQADSMGAIYKIAETTFKEAIGTLSCSEQYLVSKDGVCYHLHRGLINRDCYLLSKKVD